MKQSVTAGAIDFWSLTSRVIIVTAAIVFFFAYSATLVPQQKLAVVVLSAWLFFKSNVHLDRTPSSIDYLARMLAVGSLVLLSMLSPWSWASLAVAGLFLVVWIRSSLLVSQWEIVAKAIPFFLLLAVPDGYLENTKFAEWFASNSSSVAGFFLHFIGVESLSKGKFLATHAGTISVEYFCTPLKLLPTLYAMVMVCHASVGLKQFAKMFVWTTFVVYIVTNLRVAALALVVANKGLFEIVHNQFSRPIILVCMLLSVLPYRNIYLNLDLDPYLKR